MFVFVLAWMNGVSPVPVVSLSLRFRQFGRVRFQWLKLQLKSTNMACTRISEIVLI